ncbi:MAG: 5,10-methylene tetrahydromethanopterin reductase [Subtercola sp.]|nr:5,10-methylene tetrahydromethanopterin reductase [Subtercola sp.]
MRQGINLPINDAEGRPLDARAVQERARLAEEAGFDGLWIEDVWETGVWRPDPTEWLLPAAAGTSRIELGILDFQLAAREPVESAHELISLQALSDLRVTVGISGGTPQSHAALGTDFDTRFSRLHQNADVVRRLANGEIVGEASLETWPRVRNTLRIALSAVVENSIARSATDYDAWIAPTDEVPAEELRQRLAVYRAAGGARAIATAHVGLVDAAVRFAELAEFGFDDAILVVGDWTPAQLDTLGPPAVAA